MAYTSNKFIRPPAGLYDRFLKFLIVERCKKTSLGCLQGFWCFKLSGIVKTILTILFLTILYGFDPFGLSSSTAYHSKTLFYQWTAASYKGKDDDPVSVVMLRDESYTGSWPASAIVHAEILEAILSYKPKAVFVDFAFIDKRDDITMQSEFIPFLQEYIAEQREQADMASLYFLTVPPTSELPQGILTEIAETGVNLAYGPAQDNKFPGLKYITQAEYKQAGNNQAIQVSAAAFAIYRNQFPEQQLPSDNMELVWRLYSQPGNNGPYLCTQQCKNGSLRALHRFLDYAPDFLGELFKKSFSCLTDMPIRQICPPIKTVDAYYLLNGDFEENVKSEYSVEKLIKDKYVFYGADLDAVNDYILPPTHFPIPGVYFHAMALDNLLTYGDQYVRYTLDNAPHFSQYIGLVILILLSLGTKKLLNGINRDCNGKFDQELLNQSSECCNTLLEVAIIIIYLLLSYLTIYYLIYITFYYFNISPLSFLGLIGLIGVSTIPSLVRSYDRFIERFFSKY